MARGVIGPGTEHTYVTFLNYCFVKLISKHTCLHPSICAVLTLGHRSVSLLRVVVNAELYKLVEMLRISDREMSMGHLYQPPSTLGSENFKDNRLKGT